MHSGPWRDGCRYGAYITEKALAGIASPARASSKNSVFQPYWAGAAAFAAIGAANAIATALAKAVSAVVAILDIIFLLVMWS